jgi:hypothetical protein
MPAWLRRYGNGAAVLRWLRPMDAAIMCPLSQGVRCPMGLVLADGWIPFLCRSAGWSGVRCLQAGAWGPSLGFLPRTVLRAPSLRLDACVALAALVRALHGEVRRRRKLLLRRPATSVLARLLLAGSRQVTVPARIS